MSSGRLPLWVVALALGLIVVGGVLRVSKNVGGPEQAAKDAEEAGLGAVENAGPLPATAAALDCEDEAARQGAVALLAPARVAREFFAQSGDHGEVGSHRARVVADLAGVNLFEAGEEGEEGDPHSAIGRADRLLPPVRRPTLSYAVQRTLAAALAAPTLDAFIAAAADDPAALRRGWHHVAPNTRMREDSALGQALRERGSELLLRIREIPAAAFGLHELAATIAQGIGAADFAALLDASGVAPTSTWYASTRRYNLAVLAAVHARSRIFADLLARGVELPAGVPTVLDEIALALPTTQPAPAALAAVVTQLAALGERPSLPRTADRLAAAVPEMDALDLHPDAQALLALAEVRDSARQLARLVRDARTKAEEAQRLVDRCRDVWVAGGGDGNDLASKLAQREALLERRRRSQEGMVEQMRATTAAWSDEFLEVGEAVGDALASGDWSSVVDLLDDLAGAAPEGVAPTVLNVLLKIALSSGAPMEVVRELIQRNGAVVPPNIIMTLIASDRPDALQVAAELEAWGLDPGFADADGRNAVSSVADAFRDRAGVEASLGRTAAAWLEYLTGRSVSPQPAAQGLDPLDTVLLALLDHPGSDTAAAAATRLARILVDAGATVQSSHREIAARIQAAAPDAYARLVRVVPDLAAAPAVGSGSAQARQTR